MLLCSDNTGTCSRHSETRSIGLTQTELARRVGWTKARLNELIRGKRGITADAALDLAETLGTSPKLWMNLQATYDLDKAAKARHVA